MQRRFKAAIAGLLWAAASMVMAEQSCEQTGGAQLSSLLVARCINVDASSHPPCNASNRCEWMAEAIRIGCLGLLQDPATAPVYCRSGQENNASVIAAARQTINSAHSAWRKAFPESDPSRIAFSIEELNQDQREDFAALRPLKDGSVVQLVVFYGQPDGSFALQFSSGELAVPAGSKQSVTLKQRYRLVSSDPSSSDSDYQTKADSFLFFDRNSSTGSLRLQYRLEAGELRLIGQERTVLQGKDSNGTSINYPAGKVLQWERRNGKRSETTRKDPNLPRLLLPQLSEAMLQ